MTDMAEDNGEEGFDVDAIGGDDRVERAYRWVSAADLLSLDLTVPFHRFMGLTFAPPPALQESARAALRAEWEVEAKDEEAWIDFPRIWRAEVVSALGERAAAHLEAWLEGTYGFVATQQPQWFAWRSVFRYFVHRDSQMFHWPEELRDEIYEDYQDTVDLKDLEPLLAAARAAPGEAEPSRSAAPLSDWDVALFLRRGRFVSDREDDLDNAAADVLGPVKTVIETARLQAFCRATLARLGPEHLDELDLRARECAERVGFAPDGGLLPFADVVARAAPLPDIAD